MSNLRIAGLASGMDTDAMVQSLMRVERMKVDRFEQNKQIALWRQEQYNDINKIFANFILNSRKDIGLNQSDIRGGISSNKYNQLDYIRKASSSNEGVANVSGTSKAVNGSFDIEVKELATSGMIASADLTDVPLEGGMSFNINGEPITVGESGKDIKMSDVVKAINANKDTTGVVAFYDENNKRLFMQATETGAPKEGSLNIVLSKVIGNDAGSEFLDAVRGTGFTNTAGTDAKINYNGIDLTYSSNNFEFNGINMELKSVGRTTVKVDTNVQGIYDKVEKLIDDYNGLIDKASGLLGEKRYPSYHPLSMEEKKAMHEDDARLWEEKAKSGLLNNDETINRTLQSMRRYLYEEVEGVEGSFKHITEIGITTEKYARGSAGGKLQIDKDKLMDAIMRDPEGIMELLFKEPDYKNTPELEGKSSSTNERSLTGVQLSAKRSQSGIFNRMYDELIGGMQNIIDKSGSGENADLYRTVKGNILLDFVTNKSSISDLDKDVLNMNKRIDDLNAMLLRKENAHYAKFANMEKMLHQMYSQSDWLAQQFMY